MSLLLLFRFSCIFAFAILASTRWTEKEAELWYKQYNWSAGFNYAPSYAVNEL